MEIATKNEQQTTDEKLPFVLNSIEIIGLYDSMNYKFEFRDNKLVLLGENGSCKTTLLRIMCYALSGELERLREFSFSSICLYFDNQSPIIINKSELQNENFAEDLDFYIEKAVKDVKLLYRKGRVSGYFFERVSQTLYRKDLSALDELLHEIKYSIDSNLYYDLRSSIDDCYALLRKRGAKGKQNHIINRLKSEIKKHINDTVVLYLPTYRRIEKRISETNSFKSDNPNYEEMISFGMEDVANMINRISKTIQMNYNGNIKDNFNFNYSSILNKKPVNITDLKEIKIEKLKSIINNIDNSILDYDNRNKLSERLIKIVNDIKGNKKNSLDEIEEFLFHNYLKLEKFQEMLNEDSKSIWNFIDVCHKFINTNNKKLFFQGFNVYLKLFNKEKNGWEYIISDKNERKEDFLKKQWEKLSSGEKQIVAVFSKLYLDRIHSLSINDSGEVIEEEIDKKYFVFIDEPEMSLSIEWQRIFLEEIIHAPNCKGLVSVSHSPFIYSENELDEYTSGLDMYKY